MADKKDAEEQVKQSIVQRAKTWGENPLGPTILATLIAAQHMRPFQPLPMLFPPVLLFTTYLNLQGYKVDSAGLSAAWSGLYLLLASRRKQASFVKKLGTRGIIRGGTMGLCAANVVAGGLAYVFGNRKKEDESRGSGSI